MDQRGRRFIYGQCADGVPGAVFVCEAQAVSLERGTDFGLNKFRGGMSILLRCWAPRLAFYVE